MANITPLFPEHRPSDGGDERASELNLMDQRISCLACGGKLRGDEIHRHATAMALATLLVYGHLRPRGILGAMAIAATTAAPTAQTHPPPQNYLS